MPPTEDVAAPATTSPATWRLRDLRARGRLIAGAVALALVLVPFVAAAVNAPRWLPQGDDALIELRARDVGSRRTPLIGQPSTSGRYGQGGDHVAHPGPIEFYALAPGIRLLGPEWGALLTPAALAAACLVLVPWVVFRRAGPAVGLGAAALVALVALVAGAGGLVDPLSSNAGRLPLLLAAVVVWALWCGDLRLAPLGAVAWSYAAQQHLSVLPAAMVVGAAGAAAAAWWTVRGHPAAPAARRVRLAWLGAALVVGAALWAPVVLDQAVHDPGNLRALTTYSGDGERDDLGIGSAAVQVSRVLGPRPFLARSQITGWQLTDPRPAVATGAVLVLSAGLVGAAAWVLRRRRGAVQAAAMVGVLAVAGLATAANVPDSTEQGRLNFYHWAFALSFFELLVLGWGAVVASRRVRPPLPAVRRWAPAGVVVLILAVAAAPVVADRSTDRLPQPMGTRDVAALVDALVTSDEVRSVDGPLPVLVNGDDEFLQVGDTVGVRLRADGVDARFGATDIGFVHPDHLLDPCEAAQVLVVTLGLEGVEDPPGKLVADVPGAPGLDRAALDRLIAQSKGSEVVLGDDLSQALDALPGREGGLVGASFTFNLPTFPEEVLLNARNQALLAEHPPESPALDPDDLRSLHASMEPGALVVGALRLRAHLLTQAELREWRPELGC